jgi:hypothetical protein
VYRWSSRSSHRFRLGLNTILFYAAIYAIKACVTENRERGYRDRNNYILPGSQAVIMALDSFQINSKLVWDCHQQDQTGMGAGIHED